MVVVGAGAAGAMAAAFAAGSGARTLLLERTSDGGRKILISGGGRCNVLPARLDATRFVTSSSANLLRKILRSWPLEEQRAFFQEELGIPLALERDTGKLFPASNRARDVRDRLFGHARGRGADLRFDARVTGLRRPGEGSAPPAGSRWEVLLADGERIEAAAVILATGGLSVPKTGSDGAGMGMARALGHSVVEPYPALTPLLADPPVHAHLAGISLEVGLRASAMVGGAPLEARATGGFLFTHLGYSGPAVLDVSHVAVRSRGAGSGLAEVIVRWSERDVSGWDAALRSGPGSVGAAVREALPARLAETLVSEAGVDPALPRAQLRREDRGRLARFLGAYPLPWTGDEGYRKAEVTGGGVPLSEVGARSLESRRAPGIFLCGEILDAFGPIGGYNFVWAWATGRAAGLGAARKVVGTAGASTLEGGVR